MIKSMHCRLILLTTALMIDAIAGMALDTIIARNYAHPSTIHTIFLWAHIIIAIGIILGGIVQTILSFMKRMLRVASVIGLVSSLIAFASGGIVMDGGGKNAVFVMATFFVVALASYGFALVHLKENSRT